MEKKHRNELAAGLFVMAALGAAIGVVLWLGATEWFRPVRQRAWFYVDPAEGSVGLKEGNFLQVADTVVGRITDIRYDPTVNRVFYEAVIDEGGLVVRSDAHATVTAGLVGEARLILMSPGGPDSPPADRENPARITGGLDGAMRDLAATAKEVREIAAVIRSQITDADGGEAFARMGRVLMNLDRAVEAIARIAVNLAPDTDPGRPDAMLAEARQALRDLRAVTATVRKELQEDDPNSLLARVRGTAADAAAIAASARRETDRSQEDSLLSKGHRAADETGAILADAKPTVKRILDATAVAAEKIEDYTKKDISQVFAEFRQANSRILEIANDLSAASDATRKIVVLNRQSIDRMIDNMTQVSESLRATATELQRNPWRLLHRPRKEEMHSYNILTAAGDFTRGAAALEQALAKLKELDPKVFPADDPQIEQLRQRLTESFDRFKSVEDALWKEIAQPPE